MNNKNKTKKRKYDDIIFIKQVPVHRQDRLAHATTTIKMMTLSLLNKYLSTHETVYLSTRVQQKIKMMTLYLLNKCISILEIVYKKGQKRITHSCSRMKNKELEVAMDNVLVLGRKI